VREQHDQRDLLGGIAEEPHPAALLRHRVPHRLDRLLLDRVWLERLPLHVPLPRGLPEHDLLVGGRLARHRPDDREHGGIGRGPSRVDDRVEALQPQAEPRKVKRRATTDRLLAQLGIEDRQAAGAVAAQRQHVPVGVEQPRLRVVHRGREPSQPHDGGEVGLIRRHMSMVAGTRLLKQGRSGPPGRSTSTRGLA
jgi:hypothetical protein